MNNGPKGDFFPLYIVFLSSRHWPGKSQDLNCGYQSSSIIRAQGHWTHKTNGYKTGTKSFFPLKVLHGCCHANVMEKNDGSSCNSASYRSNLVTLGQLNWSHYVSRKFSLWNFSFFSYGWNYRCIYWLSCISINGCIRIIHISFTNLISLLLFTTQ